MGRFPSGRRNPDNPSTLLFAAGQSPLKKQYSLRIPPVPIATYDAIASRIATRQPWLEKKAQLDKAQHRLQISRDNLAQAQERLRELRERREQARKLRHSETLKAMKQAEQATKRSFEEEMKEKECKWIKKREEMERHMEEQLKQEREKLEAEAAAAEELNDTSVAEDVDPPPQKRFKPDVDIEQPHRISLDNDDEKEEGEESESAEEESRLNGDAATQEHEKTSESKLSDVKKMALQDYQKKADELTGMKVKMSWLLKTIIKKENELKGKEKV